MEEKQKQKDITFHCLRATRATLNKNIHNLESYGTEKVEIDSTFISHYLQPELHYSCRYWVYYQEQCTDQA